MDEENLNEQIVRIDWIDPHSIDEWTSLHDMDTTLTKMVTTVGRLVRETSDAYVVSLNHCPDGDVSCSMIIPKVCVKRMERWHER